MPSGRTTELEAVNTMLDCIGESPVSSLEQAGLVYVDKARAVLIEVSRKVQLRGWHFNTQDDYVLPRASDRTIPVPSNLLAADTMPVDGDVDVIVLGNRLYDKATQSDRFDKTLKLRVVWFREWDDLPESARQYITIRAARIFQTRQLGSDTLFRFSAQEEMEAFLNFQAAESDQGDVNMFTGSWSVAQIINRQG